MPVQTKPVFAEMTENAFSGISFPAEDELHVWIVPVLASVREGLNGEELAKAGRFRQSADADRFSTARLALRRLSGAYLGIAPSAIHITADLQGKPLLVNPTSRPLHFNLSHSGQLVLIAFSGCPVGADVEAIDRAFSPHDLLPEHFSEKEQEVIAAAPDPLGAFYQLWTRKEALVKGKGTGLQETLYDVTVLSDTAGAGMTADQWHLLSFASDPGYAAAVACNVSPGRVVFYRAI